VEDCGLSISSRWDVVGLRATRRVLICAQVDARPKAVPRSLLVNASHGNRSPEVGTPGTDQIDLGSMHVPRSLMQLTATDSEAFLRVARDSGATASLPFRVRYLLVQV
jgi:hypothetical protein